MTKFLIVTDNSPLCEATYDNLNNNDYFSGGLNGVVNWSKSKEFMYANFSIAPYLDHYLFMGLMSAVFTILMAFFTTGIWFILSLIGTSLTLLAWAIPKSPVFWFLLTRFSLRKSGYKGPIKLRWSAESIEVK
jgi:hypothetical protein